MDGPVVAACAVQPPPLRALDAYDAWLRKVDPEPANMLPWRCWHGVAGTRRYRAEIYGAGMGATRGVSYPQPLADAEILRWCHMRRLNEAETDFTFQLVKSLDQTFLQIRNQQIQQDLAHTFRKR
ncbi:hypothetical protein FKW15_01460 [Acetobacter sp. DmW_125133]|uniref:Uncharacterized protein n=3 Tax=Acetobacteraceae TaxID=433 RepID=A0AAN1PF64_9PROT|nr:hypothetical protein CBI36_14880 [Acetobacter oryzifermentans]AXM99142.1 hypothetical protein CJF59_00055 [Acetobacter pomorum]KAA8395612.1 hypothetical protein FKW19_09945 [Acetobacter sp. DmW_125128]KAA8396716.1 hypothetical protein FKW22_05860 [Acetobacter sp. DmW_125124]KAA8400460.1 hypothetical protein FKW20_02250 [Acetobacter sp. DmW_125127]KAA8402972.1 hypothetical protein FKW24_12780 [Acetobacter sp. DmW_125134]KAA8404611.1 hypothetical protein FKW32_08620 [Acetobacter sp. DmW_1251